MEPDASSTSMDTPAPLAQPQTAVPKREAQHRQPVPRRPEKSGFFHGQFHPVSERNRRIQDAWRYACRAMNACSTGPLLHGTPAAASTPAAGTRPNHAMAMVCTLRISASAIPFSGLDGASVKWARWASIGRSAQQRAKSHAAHRRLHAASDLAWANRPMGWASGLRYALHPPWETCHRERPGRLWSAAGRRSPAFSGWPGHGAAKRALASGSARWHRPMRPMPCSRTNRRCSIWCCWTTGSRAPMVCALPSGYAPGIAM